MRDAMQSFKSGSAMLVIVIVMTSLMTLTTIVWYQHSLLHDIAIAKEQYEKRLQLTRAVLTMGIVYVKKRGQFFWTNEKNNQKVSVVLRINTLPLCPDNSAAIQCMRIKDRVRIRALLHENGKQIFGLQCQVTKNGKIHEWTIEQI
jgi:hypothetical protein